MQRGELENQVSLFLQMGYGWLRRRNDIHYVPIGTVYNGGGSYSLAQLTKNTYAGNSGFDDFSCSNGIAGVIFNTTVVGGVGGKMHTTVGEYVIMDEFGNCDYWNAGSDNDYFFTSVGKFYVYKV